MNKPNGWLTAGLCVAVIVCLYQESRIRQRDRLLEAQRRELTAARDAYQNASQRAAVAEAGVEDVRRKSSFMDNVRESFGENTASAVHLFESSQKSAYKELRLTGASNDPNAPVNKP